MNKKENGGKTMIFTNELKIAITVSAVGIGCIVCKNLIKSVKANYILKVDQRMNETKDPEIDKFEARVQDLKYRATDIRCKESRDINKKVSSFKKEINYDDKLASYKKSVADGVADFKTDINADLRIKEAENKFEKAINDYKVANAYDVKLKALKKKISDAESEYKSKKTLYKDNLDTDSAKALKKIAKSTRDEIIDSAKKDIDEIESSFNDFKLKEESIRDSDISSIRKQISDREVRLQTAADNHVDALNKQVSDYRDKVTSEIFSKRTYEDQMTIDEYESCNEELKDIHEKEAARRSAMLADVSFMDKLAVYLHDKGWKQWQVYAVGATPLMVAGYFAAKYIEWLVNFSKAVSTGLV